MITSAAGLGRRLRLLRYTVTAMMAISMCCKPSSFRSHFYTAAYITRRIHSAESYDIILDNHAAHIHRDKRGGSKMGRKKRLNRSPCQWREQYLAVDSVYPPKMFQETFGVPRAIYDFLMQTLGDELTDGPDCCGTPSMPADIAILSALRILRTGNSIRQMDDMVGQSKSTIANKFTRFLQAVCDKLGPVFLPDTPNESIDRSIMMFNSTRGFPGCAGSFDCTHFTWRCPKYLQPLYKGKEGNTTIVAQAIASPDLYCTHLFVGSPGTNNDLTTLRIDPYIQAVLDGSTASKFDFSVNGESFSFKYYLADGIYPPWSIFATPISNPSSTGERRYTNLQESFRKEVECLFGVVKQRFKFVRSGNRIEFGKETACNGIRAAFIIHNLIVLYCSGGIAAIKNMFESSVDSGNVFDDGAASGEEVMGSNLVGEFGTDSSDSDSVCELSDRAAIVKNLIASTRNVISSSDHMRLRNALVSCFS